MKNRSKNHIQFMCVGHILPVWELWFGFYQFTHVIIFVPSGTQFDEVPWSQTVHFKMHHRLTCAFTKLMLDEISKRFLLLCIKRYWATNMEKLHHYNDYFLLFVIIPCMNFDIEPSRLIIWNVLVSYMHDVPEIYFMRNSSNIARLTNTDTCNPLFWYIDIALK